MVKDFLALKDIMNDYITDCVKLYFCEIYDVFSEQQVILETYKIINKHLQDSLPMYPSEYYPQCRIKRIEDWQMQIQVQEYFNDIKGWKYIGTISMPDTSKIHDVYLKTDLTGFEPFILMTKYDHDAKSINVGGHIAVEQWHHEIMSPLSMAYQYAIDEEIL